MGSYARRVAAALQELAASKVVQLAGVRAGQGAARSTAAEIATLGTSPLACEPRLLPLAEALVQLRHLASLLLALPELSAFAELAAAARRRYCPEGAAEPPVPAALFDDWLLFDLALGQDRETLATCACDLAPWLLLDDRFLGHVQRLQQAPLRLYRCGGGEEGRIWLQDVETARGCRCVFPGATTAPPGSLWLARLVIVDDRPDQPAAGLLLHEPGLLLSPGERLWRRCLGELARSNLPERLPRPESGPRPGSTPSPRAGLDRLFWLEFFATATVGQSGQLLLLQGLP